ncbi:MAG TPA: hypothetical protein VJ689_10560 [Gaiellaceae bacterium]|nr:hypothetical protein [Gaiellaceae bacterium]
MTRPASGTARRVPFGRGATARLGGKWRLAAILGTAAVLAVIAVLNVRSTFTDPVTWTPDGVYYQAKLLEYRGVDHDEAIAETFGGPLSAELRARDPLHTGDPDWVAYNEPFYERRIAVPLAGAALYSVDGDRALLDLSLAGYVASVLAVFGLLLLRFRLAVAAAVGLATVFLPALVDHSSFPLTDSWGLALETAAFAAAILTLDRGRRWLPLFVLAILLLSITRDSAWIPLLAVGWCAWRLRSREALWLFVGGVAAALPALLLFTVPARNLLAQLVNGGDIPPETSWSYIASHYPHAVVELVRANGGFLRDGEWFTGLYLIGGVVLLLVLALRGHYRRSRTTMLMTAGTAVGLLYLLAAPLFSAFRLELVFVPMAAYGLALGVTVALARLMGEAEATEPRVAPSSSAIGSPSSTVG